MKKEQLISGIKYLLLLGIGVLLLVFAFKGQDPQKLWADLKSANYFWVLIALAVMFLSHWFRALRWNMMIEPLGYKPKTINTFNAVIIGYMANLAFPRMGEVSRCGVLVKTDKLPMNSLIGTVVVERLIDLISLAVVLLLAIVFEFNRIMGFLNTYLFDPLVNKVQSGALALSIALVLLIVGFGLTWWLFQHYKERIYASAFGMKVLNLLRGIREGMTTLMAMEKLWLFILYSALIWFCYFLNAYLLFSSMSVTSNLGLAAALVVLTVGSFGMTAPVQGGIGAFHFMVREGLVLFNIDRTDGLVFATISHSSQTLAIIVIGALSLFYVSLQKDGQARTDQ